MMLKMKDACLCLDTSNNSYSMYIGIYVYLHGLIMGTKYYGSLVQNQSCKLTNTKEGTDLCRCKRRELHFGACSCTHHVIQNRVGGVEIIIQQ